MTTIGFVGLGNMGGPMVARLLGTGYTVHVFDIDADALQTAVAAGAKPCTNAAECAAVADVFLTSLPRPDHVENVMLTNHALAALRPGSVWVDLTTNNKQLVIDAAAAAPDGVAVLDSPVTGAVDGARQGKLTLFVGGDDAAFSRVEPILANLGTVRTVAPPRATSRASARASATQLPVTPRVSTSSTAIIRPKRRRRRGATRRSDHLRRGLPA